MLLCPVRKRAVSDLPEERLRVQLLNYLITEKKFPPRCFLVEASLAKLSSFSPTPLPPDLIRRLDILATVEYQGSLKPLLLIECKAQISGRAPFRQLLAYNHYIRAPYLLLADPQGLFFAAASNDTAAQARLPDYETLRSSA